MPTERLNKAVDMGTYICMPTVHPVASRPDETGHPVASRPDETDHPVASRPDETGHPVASWPYEPFSAYY